MSWQWSDFLLGLLVGAGIVLLVLLWHGVRAVQAERQRLAQLRERGPRA